MKILETKIDFGPWEGLEAHVELQMGISQARNNFLKPFKSLGLSFGPVLHDIILKSNKSVRKLILHRGG